MQVKRPIWFDDESQSIKMSAERIKHV